MSQPMTRSRVYSGLFLCTLLIVIPYLIGGTAGVLVALVFAGIVGGLTGLVNQFWLVMGFNGLSPTASLILKGFIIAFILIALYLVIYIFFVPHTPWLPVAD